MRDVSVLFSDLRGYSTLSERLTPERVIEFMNVYFQAMQEVIERHRGVVLELLGDAILVVFGAPDKLTNHAESAIKCALAMRDRLERLNESLPVELGNRIGIHTGQVVAGNIGGQTYMKYGVIGDVVNVAARLEQLNKKFETSVLVSEEVRRQLPEALREQGTDRGEVVLKGRARPQHVFSF
jgi:adenylate cyclase